MSELQDMLCVQARLHRKQGANALGDLFENALNEIELLKKTYNQLFDAVQGEREQLAKANERVEELERFQEEVAYKCFTAGLNTEKPKGPSGKNQTATEINHFEVMVDRYVIGTSRSILEQLRKEQGDDK